MREVVVSFFAFFVLSSSQLSAQVIYSIADLGTLGGTSSRAYGINNLGQVVGQSVNALGNQRGFLWTPGGNGGVVTNPQMSDLGVLSGHLTSTAFGINNLGQVTGSSYPAFDPNNGVAYLWTPGASGGTPGNPQMQSLGTLGGLHSTGIMVTNSGQVVGEADPPTGNGRAMLWTPGGTNGIPSNPQMQNLGSLGNASSATAMNTSGVIVGWTSSPNASVRAFVYDNGTMTDIGTLMGSAFGVYSRATDINDAGVVCGWSGSINGFRAFKYQNGVMTNLGDLGGSNRWLFASSINEAGVIVGSESPIEQEPQRAWLYDTTGIHDLNTMIAPGSGWTLRSADDINDLGQIVGYGTYNGQSHAFLLTPIPEPTSIVLCSLCVGVTVAYRQRCQKRARK